MYNKYMLNTIYAHLIIMFVININYKKDPNVNQELINVIKRFGD